LPEQAAKPARNTKHNKTAMLMRKQDLFILFLLKGYLIIY